VNPAVISRKHKRSINLSRQTKMKPSSPRPITRREAIRRAAGGATALALLPRLSLAEDDPAPALAVDPAPRFELSPYLYMQFMEPLGVTDSSVEAAWDHGHDRWREDVVEVTRALAPTMLRWGGIFTDYYRWREGVGPRDKRPMMLNLLWGGLESNQVGTAEFVDFCRRTGAAPLICVNFESDGRPQFKEAKGRVRTADAREAADWVAYCNAPDNPERRSHGHSAPLPVKFWQLGNETSYDRRGFDLETAARKSVEFAKAMRQADSDIQIIAWGDSGWAGRMLEVAGEHVQFLAFHHMFNPDTQEPVLRGELYRRDPAATWDVLMKAWEKHDARIRQMRDSLDHRTFPLAMTECHFAIPGRNRCDVLSTWTAGVSYARMLNSHQRHGDLLKIATAADFCGTRWQVNALMIPVPGGRAYLMPVARVMQLYRLHTGTHAATVNRAPEGLDVVASRTEDTMFLHVVNTHRTRPVRAALQVDGRSIAGGRVFTIADEPMVEVSPLNSADVMTTAEKPLAPDGIWEFPAASVSAVEMRLVKKA
jgi:alpha-L-arabinofuranosidase